MSGSLALSDSVFLGKKGARAALDAPHGEIENGFVGSKSDKSAKAQVSTTWAFVYLAPSN
jgi:hypothetical protein